MNIVYISIGTVSNEVDRRLAFSFRKIIFFVLDLECDFCCKLCEITVFRHNFDSRNITR